MEICSPLLLKGFGEHLGNISVPRAPLASPGGPDFRHFYQVVVSGVFFLAPAAFWVLYTRETIEREERKRLAMNHAREEKNWELESLAERFAKEKEKLLAAIRVRDAEIERLRLRDRYLTEGKPQFLAGQATEKPNLEYL